MTRRRKYAATDGEERLCWGSPDYPHPFVEIYDAETGTWKPEI